MNTLNEAVEEPTLEILSPNDFFTLGVSFYDKKQYIMEAMSQFNLKEEFFSYMEERKGEEDLNLQEFYADFVERLQKKQLVRYIRLTLSIVPPGSSGHEPFEEGILGLAQGEIPNEWMDIVTDENP